MKQRDIILVPFPFSDQSGQKVRPALIVSNDSFNKASNDLLVCAITTNLKPSKYSVLIGKKDIEDGILYEVSSIKVENIFKIQKSLVIKTIATIKDVTFSKVIEILFELFKDSS